MRKLIPLLLALFLVLGLCACGQSPAPAAGTQPAVSQDALPSHGDKMYEKYADVIDAMEAGDYDAALEAVKERRKNASPALNGDIEDYLVRVEITPENFADYFEFYHRPVLNAFGEDTGDIFFGLRSKAYDRGLILYHPDDPTWCDPVSVEYTWSGSYNRNDPNALTTDTSDSALTSLLVGHMLSGDASSHFAQTFQIVFTGRLTSGTLTFVRADYVLSYDIPEKSDPDASVVWASVVLMNGEQIGHTIVPDEPF